MSWPARRNIDIYVGDKYTHIIQRQDANGNAVALSDTVQYRAQIRAKATDESPLVSFTVTLDREAGTITLDLTSAQTRTLANYVNFGAVWDVEEYELDNEPFTSIAGDVRLKHDVSRA